ncbi:MAG TPA: VOC family protein, partial [Polyangiales bacterium]|nr:VOC family protein [Polyangiales bacterium]
MSNATHLPGKFVWFELATTDATRTQRFYAEVLGWKTVPFAMGPTHYDMIYVGDTMIGGYAAAPSGDQTPHWMSYVSVEDVDQAVTRAAALGGRVIVPPFDARGVGRRAKIADPQGAEVWLFTKQTSDPIDGESAPGTWCWNELHTPDPAAAVAFYEQVVGYSHRAIDMGAAGTYFILSQGG